MVGNALDPLVPYTHSFFRVCVTSIPSALIKARRAWEKHLHDEALPCCLLLQTEEPAAGSLLTI